MDDYKQFLDFTGLAEYDKLIKQYMQTTAIKDLETILGELEIKIDTNATNISNLKIYIDEQYDSIQALEKNSIDTLFNKEE